MYSLNDFFSVLNEFAPLKISEQAIEQGDYDNSGIIICDHERINGVLFSVDLSLETVKQAKKCKADTIVTHHPAIYYPIKNISCYDSDTAPLLSAIKSGINVISMHLNCDMAKNGIDYAFACGLGAFDMKILTPFSNDTGYGREFETQEISLKDYVKKLKTIFCTDKIISYGNAKTKIKKVASFCGAGGSNAVKCVKNGDADADVIVSSDIPHHHIKALTEKGKALIIIPHYTAENFGFKYYYETIQKKLGSSLNLSYFEDKRFI